MTSVERDALAVLQPPFAGPTAPGWLLRLLEEGLTGVGLFGSNIESPEQLAALTAALREARPEVLIATDEEGGDVTRLDAETGSAYPGNHALGAVDDPDLTRAVAAAIGSRLAACGVNVDWAPCADVNSDPRNPVIGVRSFGDDPALVARHTAAYVEGLQSAGVAACVKHFPGHGDTHVDSHLALPRVDVTLDQLRRRDLVPFEAAIAAGTRCVMSAHILLPALDPAHPATLSPAALAGLLRAPAEQGGLGFDGLIYTDAIEMKAISDTHGLAGGCVLAIAAGADALCVGGEPCDEEQVLYLRDALVAAVREGRLSEERLHDAAERVRALGAWAAAARATASRPQPPTDIGLQAARRALRVIPGTAPFRPLTTPPYVAALTPGVTMAVGRRTPWGLEPALNQLLPGTRGGCYGPHDVDAPGGGAGAAAARILADAGERPVVAVVRDAHRHPWMQRILAALLQARPATAVVEMGVPHGKPAGAPYLATHGAARVCGQAAAEALTGR